MTSQEYALLPHCYQAEQASPHQAPCQEDPALLHLKYLNKVLVVGSAKH